MKKRTLRSIAFVLVVCLVIPSFFAMAGAADYAPLRYDTSSLCSAALSISSSTHLAECKGTICLYSQYRNGTIDASIGLWKSSDRKTWSIDSPGIITARDMMERPMRFQLSEIVMWYPAIIIK